MHIYTEYLELLKRHDLLERSYQRALKPWTCSFLCHLFDFKQPKSILEIGRSHGHSLGLMRWLDPYADITSVDPSPQHTAHEIVDILPGQGKVRFENVTSDAFFAGHKGDNFDFVLIDGDHSYAAVKRDWDNTRKWVNTGAVVMFDNIDLGGDLNRCPFNHLEGVDKHTPFMMPIGRNPLGQFGIVFI